jgi:hypothetical protein
VAGFTGNILIDVPLVIEEYVFGDVVDFCPGRRLIVVKILVFFLDPGMLDDDVIMAMQTLCHRRQTGKIRVRHIGMAVLTLDLFDPAVNIVTEGYRLFGSDFRGRHNVEKNQERPAEYNAADDDK